MKINEMLFVPLLLSLLLTGCSGSGGESDVGLYNALDTNYEPEYYTEDYAVEGGLVATNGVMADERWNDEKLVYNSDISIETLEYNESLEVLRSIINDCGGYIESENESNGSYYTSSQKRINMTARIPSKEHSNFLGALDGVGHITNKSSSVDNITNEYNDTSVTVDSLKIQEQRLLDMYDSAQTIDEMIQVESRLAEVQRQLESYSMQLSRMDNEVAYATITINLQEVKQITEEEPPSHFGDILDAFVSSAASFLLWLKALVISIIYALPYIAIITVIGAIINKVSKRRKQKKDGNNVGTIPRQSDDEGVR